MRDLADAEPDSIYQMIGQEQVKNQVITAVDAAQNAGGPFESPVLCVGPGGCGKSQNPQAPGGQLASLAQPPLALGFIQRFHPGGRQPAVTGVQQHFWSPFAQQQSA